MGEPQWITYDAVAGGPELTSVELRQIQAAFFEGPAGGQVYSGVRYGTGAVSLAGTTITHQAVNFVIQGVASSTGAYVGFEPTGTKTLSPAHATLARVDRVWTEVQDTEADSSGQRRSIVVYALGTPGGAPASLPATATLQAEINVPINNTAGAVVVDKRTYYNAPPSMQLITASGNWNRPPGLKAIRVRGVAGGGAGGAAFATGVGQGTAGGGGGGGGYFEGYIDAAQLGSTVAVTIGAGGVAGAVPTAGGATSFGGFMSATGGGPGGNGNAASAVVALGGAGGAGTGGTVNIDGGDGDVGRVDAGAPVDCARGGNSVLGMGGQSGANILSSVGSQGQVYGGGGGGGANRASQTAVNGGPGAAGAVIVEHVFS